MEYVNHPQMLIKFILGVNPHEMDVGWWHGKLEMGVNQLRMQTQSHETQICQKWGWVPSGELT